MDGDVQLGEFANMPVERPFPGVERRYFHTDKSTVSRYSFEPGAKFPLHKHPEEQITLIESGAVTFTVGGAVHALSGGAWSVVAPDVEHGIVAGPQGAHVVAVVTPRRATVSAYTIVEEER